MVEFIWDPISAINLVLCAAILVLGSLGYHKKRNRTQPS